MASIQTRVNAAGDTTYRVMYRSDGQQMSEGFRDPKAAAEFLVLLERVGPDAARQIRLARATTTGRTPTLEEWFAHHVEHATAVTPGTAAEYERLAARTWLPHLGPLPVDAITRDHVTRWVGIQARTVTRRGTPTSAKTIRNAHNLLSTVIGSAVPELRPDNPARGVPLPSGIQEEMTFLSESEFAALLGHVKPYWQPFVLLLAGTGLRWGEATALRWGDVDLDASTPVLRVAQSWKRGRTVKVLGAPKTSRSRRTVSLPEQVIAALDPLRDRGDLLVFRGPNGGGMHHQSWHPRVWRPAVDAANDPDKAKMAGHSPIGKQPRIHDLRHSHVSWMIAAGVPLPIIQRRLGHESIKTTVDRYGHLAGGHLELAAEVATAALALAVPEQLALEA